MTKKIVLHVEEKNVATLMTILENLKEGLIVQMEVDKRSSYIMQKQSDTPKNPPKPVELTGKYIDPQTFKQRLQGMKKR